MSSNWSRSVAFICLFSLLWAAVLAVDIAPQIRGDFGWRWPYAVLTEPGRLVPLSIALALYLLIARHIQERGRALFLQLWAILGTVVLTVAALFATTHPFLELYTATLAAETGGWHYIAAHTDDMGQTLREWPTVMRRSVLNGVSHHMGHSPPGMVLTYYAANEVLESLPGIADQLGPPLRAAQCANPHVNDYSNAEFSTTWLGILMPLWAGLTVLPLFRLGRRLFGEPVARWSVMWWPLLPGVLMFSPSPNTALPLFSILAIATLLKGLLQNKPFWVWLAGLIMSVLTFMTLAYLPLLLLAGLITSGVYWQHERLKDAPRLRPLTWFWPVRMGLWYGLGLLVVWLIFYGVSGITAWDIYHTASLNHMSLERPYLPWLFLHPYDYFMFTGWPLVFLAGIGVGYTWRRWRSLEGLAVADVFVIAAALMFVLLMLSGTLRGETGRILLYFSPFLLLLAGYGLVQKNDVWPAHSAWWLTLAQVGLILVLVAFLRVGGSDFMTLPPLRPPALSQEPPPGYVSGVIFAKHLQLQSFAGQVTEQPAPDGTSQPLLTLWLQWQATGQVEIPYWLSLIPVAPNGDTALAADLQQPFEGSFATTCWLPHSGSFWQQVNIPVFSVETPGDWWVSLALIDVKTGQKAAVIYPDGTLDEQVGLGPIPDSK